MSFQKPITIKKVIDNIENNKYLLPAIQREFVWNHKKIEWLFDSIMRNYPISSFLFWDVKGETTKGYKFYKFINEFREVYKIHNDEISTDGINEFKAILDGQQRLTSIYIGLKGSFAYRGYRKKKVNSENSLPTRHLYLNISKELEDEEDGRVYEFKFLKKEDTKEKSIYIAKTKTWFKVGTILNYTNDEKFDDFVEELETSFARKAIRQLRRVILEKEVINFFLEEEQDLDKALNIFIRINSGGEPLNFSDLIMSIAVANWKHKDARKEIHTLVDNIRDKGFSVSKDFVLKVFLYLYSNDIKFKVKNFSTENAKEFENQWENIRSSILEIFDLIKSYGFTEYTLTSKNALIPIIYYVYHKNIYSDFTTKKQYESDRKKIKKWLHVVLIKGIFGGSSDVTLHQIRNAFTDNFKNIKINDGIIQFPYEMIYKKIKKDTTISDEFINELLCTQKDEKYSFSILALLYPNLDYENNNFHKDHLHPISKFDNKYIEELNISEEIKTDYFRNIYVNNSISNLQMLSANENMSKKDMDLEEWIDKECSNKDKKQFLKDRLIPDIDLSFENFKNFINERNELLTAKLKKVLN